MSYRLVIHDDETHTFDYVIDIFVRVLGVGREEAFKLALAIHERGHASVNFFELGNAREAEERLLSGGHDPRLSGSNTSLTVSVEEVLGAEAKLLSRGRVGPRGYEALDDRQVVALHAASQVLHGHFVPRHCAPNAAAERAAAAVLLLLMGLVGFVLIAMLKLR